MWRWVARWDVCASKGGRGDEEGERVGWVCVREVRREGVERRVWS